MNDPLELYTIIGELYAAGRSSVEQIQLLKEENARLERIVKSGTAQIVKMSEELAAKDAKL